MLLSCYKEYCVEAGCDEAGRGCLAGPVVAAAVILPAGFQNNLLNDSKQVTEKNRNILRKIIEAESISFGVAFVDNNEIDKINILKASIKAMHLALDKLNQIPEHIIIDGNRFFPYKQIPYCTVVKGDAKYYAIAAASILAKTYRDEYMEQIDSEFPEFLWRQNKGYPTKDHRKAIRNFGISAYHRKTFRLLNEQLEIRFE